MRKIIILTVCFAMLLIVALSGLAQINGKSHKLRKDRDGIEYRLLVLKADNNHPESR